MLCMCVSLYETPKIYVLLYHIVLQCIFFFTQWQICFFHHFLLLSCWPTIYSLFIELKALVAGRMFLVSD